MELGDDPSGNGFWREIGSDSNDLKGPVFLLLPALMLGPNLVSVGNFSQGLLLGAPPSLVAIIYVPEAGEASRPAQQSVLCAFSWV